MFSEVRREEARREVMLKNIDEQRTNVDGSALMTRVPDLEIDRREGKKRPWCGNCKKPWHTRGNCWKLHGKPANWKKNLSTDAKLGGDFRAFQVSHTKLELEYSSTSLPFTKEQIELLHKMFQSQPQSNSTCSIAQSGNHLFAFMACAKSNCSWILDPGATDHRTGTSQFLSSYTPCAGNQNVRIADGSFASVAGKGTVNISPSFIIRNVLHIPHLSYNLLFVSQLTRDHKCRINFWSFHCEFQDLSQGRRLGC